MCKHYARLNVSVWEALEWSIEINKKLCKAASGLMIQF
jgi:hypothetical protein